MIGEASLQGSTDALLGLCGDVRSLISVLDQMSDRLNDARRILSGVDDVHARNAECEIRTALTALNEARGVWLESYLRRSESLCQRIVS